MKDVPCRVVDRAKHKNHGYASKQSRFQAAHRAELVGHIVIFKRGEQVRVIWIDARGNLRIGFLTSPELKEEERKREQQEWRQGQEQDRHAQKMKKVSNSPSKRCGGWRCQRDTPSLRLVRDEFLHCLANLPRRHSAQ